MKDTLEGPPKIAYLPVGRETFDIDSARRVFEDTLLYLRSLPVEVAAPEKIIVSPEELEKTLEHVSGDLAVVQLTTFVDARFVRLAAERLGVPVVIWSVNEPETGARLRLNSLTGGNSAAHLLRGLRYPYSFVYGDPGEVGLREKLERSIRVQKVAGALSRLVVGVVGEHPPGFFFADTDEGGLQRLLGTRLHRVDLNEVFEGAAQVPEEEWRPVVEETREKVSGVDPGQETVVRFARLTAYLRRYAAENGLRALAVRNWPEFFDEYGAAADGAMSLLTDAGLPAANESDVHGAITMYAGQVLSGTPVYLGDLAYLDGSSGGFVFWHDGSGAPSLANPVYGARAGVHPNRGIGLTLEMGLKPGRVTVARLGRSGERFRLLVFRGEVVEAPQQFFGTCAVVRPDVEARRLLHELLEEGWEPHYGLVYGDWAQDFVELGRLLGVEVVEHGR